MKRLAGWRSRLQIVLLECEGRKFAWRDEADCALGLVVPAIAAQTGVDLGLEWRGTYATAFGAAREIKRRGFADLPAIVASHFRKYDHPIRAGYGDIAVMRGNETGWALGIFAGSGGEIITALSPEGCVHVPRSRAEMAFAIQ